MLHTSAKFEQSKTQFFQTNISSQINIFCFILMFHYAYSKSFDINISGTVLVKQGTTFMLTSVKIKRK